MSTTFRIHLYDTYYDVYKNNTLLVSTDVPVNFYPETVLCFEEIDPLSPRGYSYKYFYHLLISTIGLVPSCTTVNDFRTIIKWVLSMCDQHDEELEEEEEPQYNQCDGCGYEGPGVYSDGHGFFICSRGTCDQYSVRGLSRSDFY